MGSCEKYAVSDSESTKMQSDDAKPSEISAILQRKLHLMADRTIAPIVPRIIYEAWLWRKIFWLMCYILCWVVFLRSTYELILKYQSYSVNTEIKIEYYKELQFPAVTVCDMNRIDKESSDGTDVTGDLLHSDEALWMSVFEKLSEKYSSGIPGNSVPPGSGDEFSFTYKPCPRMQFRCEKSPGKQCFDDSYKCDFRVNCHNGEDEQNSDCPFNSLDSPITFGDLLDVQQWACEVAEQKGGDYEDIGSFSRQHYLHCCDYNKQTSEFEKVLPPWTRCDGYYHCKDQSDEQDCQYANSFPFCSKNPNYTAIVDTSIVKLAPKQQMCLSATPDELDCKRWCKDECLDATLVCDGNVDCPNGLDEIGCETPDAIAVGDYTWEALDEDSLIGLADFDDAQFQPSFEDEVFLDASESLVGQLRRTARKDPFYTSVRAKLTHPESMIGKHGMSRQSLIKLCTYNNYPCTGKDKLFYNFWSKWKDIDYGNCYTFNHAATNFSQRNDNMMKSTGPSSGLHLTLSVDSSSYMPLLTNAVGVVVSVHSNKGHALPKTSGTLLRPGTLNRLAVEKHQVNKAGAPYNTCVYKYPDFILDNQMFIADDVKPFLNTYTSALCVQLCQALHQLLSCSKGNCRYGYLLNQTVTKNQGIPDCNLERITHFNCFQETKATVSSYENCGCRQACTKVSFQQFLSVAEFPSPAYVPFLLNSILEAEVESNSSKSGGGSSKWMDEVAETLYSIRGDYMDQTHIDEVTKTLQKSLIDVEVFYNSLYVTEISESPAYTILKLLADFGGNSGLYVGFCALSLFEIIEFMWDVTYAIIRRKLAKYTPQESIKESTNNGEAVSSC